MQQSLSSKAPSTHGSADSLDTFNHSDKAAIQSAGSSALDTPVFDELLDLLIPTVECVDCLFRPDGCSTCAQSTAAAHHGRFANDQEALLSFIGACFSDAPSYHVKQGIYTYLNPSSLRGYSSGRSSVYTAGCVDIDDAETGLAVLNVAMRRIIGKEHCFNTDRMETVKKSGKITERRRNINPYKLVMKSDLRLITISGFKSFNYLDSQLIATLTRGREDGFHGFLWLDGTGKPKFMNPPKDVIMCCDMEESFNERMVAIHIMGVTETKLIRHFNSKLGFTAIDGLEDLMALLIAEKEGIKAKCLAVFKKTHTWYRDEVIPLSEDTVVDNFLMG